MSVDFYARIQKKCITEGFLSKQLHGFFEAGNNEKNVKHMLNDDIFITFIEEKKPPYNIYEFQVCDGKFRYKQLIIFDINKKIFSDEAYKLIIEFCKKLGKEIESRILVTSDAHNEICMIENEKVKWFNNSLK